MVTLIVYIIHLIEKRKGVAEMKGEGEERRAGDSPHAHTDTRRRDRSTGKEGGADSQHGVLRPESIPLAVDTVAPSAVGAVAVGAVAIVVVTAAAAPAVFHSCN